MISKFVVFSILMAADVTCYARSTKLQKKISLNCQQFRHSSVENKFLLNWLICTIDNPTLDA